MSIRGIAVLLTVLALGGCTSNHHLALAIHVPPVPAPAAIHVIGAPFELDGISVIRVNQWGVHCNAGIGFSPNVPCIMGTVFSHPAAER